MAVGTSQTLLPVPATNTAADEKKNLKTVSVLLEIQQVYYIPFRFQTVDLVTLK